MASRVYKIFTEPHLYAPLDLAAVLWTERLSLGEDRVHSLPEGVFV
jgi:uncharacterized protein (DUF952 family)